ncbi:MAG: hypothetical protein B6229_01180 [Spirochaetaceae bacterium 4572_7]|nr:MAG: hypothetical protein B6229_01180 [Spirochaetaceae bacterium 4572_7]
MRKVKLIFGTYNSQSPEEESATVEEYYQRAYKTFLTTMYNFPEIKLSLQYSGSLLEWIEANHPEFISVLQEMIAAKQIELLSGGYYDPAFTLLSVPDRVGQMEKLTTSIRKTFGKKPRGCFLAENVWDSSLVPSLKSCGFDYIYLDDNQFLAGGVTEADLLKPVITEDQGKIITVIPISSVLNSMFLRSEPSELIDYIRDNSHRDGVFTIMFKGEYLNSPKMEPDKIKIWLDEFNELLKENSIWIETLSPAKYVKQIQGSLNRCYFPQYSINGMRNRPLPLICQRELNRLNRHLGALGDVTHWINSGFFKQFLSRYRDASILYSKMTYINLLVNQIKGDKSRKKSAKEDLWHAQSHYAYWHGNHLGIYDKNLRERSFSFLIEAEKTTREKGIFKSGISHFDVDLDGRKEALYQGDNYNAYISCRGGCIFQFDYLTKKRNLVATVMRLEETYHGNAGIKNGYDTYIRKMFHDHFISSKCKISDFKRQSFTELGSFIDCNYEFDSLNRGNKSVALVAKGEVLCNEVEYRLIIKKKYHFNKNSLIITYDIENLEDSVFESMFAPEFNLSLGTIKENSTASFSDGTGGSLIGETIEAKKVDSLSVEDKDNSTKISLSFSEETKRFWVAPQYSNSMKNGSIKNYYQFTTFLPQWKVKILPQKTWALTINLSLN